MYGHVSDCFTMSVADSHYPTHELTTTNWIVGLSADTVLTLAARGASYDQEYFMNIILWQKSSTVQIRISIDFKQTTDFKFWNQTMDKEIPF